MSTVRMTTAEAVVRSIAQRIEDDRRGEVVLLFPGVYSIF